MIDIRARIDEVLGKGRVMSLGTVDEGGVWVADILYAHDTDLNIYWISRKERRHSIAIRNHPQVSVAVTLSTPSDTDLGIQLSGIAQELAETPAIADAYWLKRAEPAKKPITDAHAWYKLTPTKIELMDEVNFDHEKKALEL